MARYMKKRNSSEISWKFDLKILFLKYDQWKFLYPHDCRWEGKYLQPKAQDHVGILVVLGYLYHFKHLIKIPRPGFDKTFKIFTQEMKGWRGVWKIEYGIT